MQMQIQNIRAGFSKCPLFQQLTMRVLQSYNDQQSYQGPEVYIWVMDWVSEQVSEIAVHSNNPFIMLCVFMG